MRNSDQTSNVSAENRALYRAEPPHEARGDRRARAIGSAAGGPAHGPWAPGGARHIHVRPVEPDDRLRLAGLFARMSPESRLRRYFTPKPELSPNELAYLTNVDHVAHEALAAVDTRDGSIVGVVRYVRFSDGSRGAEMAFKVADDAQGMGIGTLLARRLIERARANGVELLSATTLWENRPARALLRRLGFHARASQGAEIRLELVLSPTR